MIQAWIAVVGGFNAERLTDPKNLENARTAARNIGRALAARGCGIIVYSSDPQFIECDVVAGFASAPTARPESIRVIYPRSSAPPQFPEQQSKPGYFKFRIDSHPSWEVSFYRSLYGADGLLIIGGGQSTFAAGILAATQYIPTVALDAYGGAGSSVWELITADKAFLNEDEKNLMAERNHSSEWAEKIVDCLVRQKAALFLAREQQKNNKTARHREVTLQAIFALLLLGGGLVSFVATWGANLDRAMVLTAIVAAPTLAGGAASIVRTLWEQVADGSPAQRPVWVLAFLGSVAGSISGLLYVVPQLTAMPSETAGQLPAISSRLVPFALLGGFLAGFAMDAFFRKIRDTETPQIQMPAFNLPKSPQGNPHV